MSQPEDELRWRLADLAESAGPWADPLPAVIRHAHPEPQHRRALLPAGRRKWSLAAAVVITFVVAIAFATHKCQRPAPQDGPASNKAEHALVRPLGPVRVGGFVRSSCAPVAPVPEASTPASPRLSVKYLRAHESEHTHERIYPRVLRAHCHHQDNCPSADQGQRS